MDIKRKLTRVRRFQATAIDDSQLIQTVQVKVRPGDVSDQAEHYQNYGLTSVPDAAQGVAGLVIEVAGHRFVIGLEEPEIRPKNLEAGEVMLYHREGHHIHLLKGGKVVLNATEWVINCPKTLWNGDITQTGQHISTGDQVANGISQTKHDHTDVHGSKVGKPN